MFKPGAHVAMKLVYLGLCGQTVAIQGPDDMREHAKDKLNALTGACKA